MEVAQAYWDDGSIRVSFDGAGLGSDSAAEEEEFDYVWLATGGNLDLNLVPILASLQSQRPITTAGGLPMLQPDLSWDVGCPLYVMGAFAGLQLGADALNLAGARSGGVLGPPIESDIGDDEDMACSHCVELALHLLY